MCPLLQAGQADDNFYSMCMVAELVALWYMHGFDCACIVYNVM